MKKYLKNFYNIRIDNIYKDKSNYIFKYQEYLFLLYRFQEDDKKIITVKEIIEKLHSNNVPVHALVMNKYSKYITLIENEKYVLMRVIATEKSITEKNILNFFYKVSYGECEWKKLWIAKLDYYEKRLIEDFNNNIEMKTFFEYYSGFVEIGIDAIFQKNFYDLYITHKRITNNPIDYYNPFNFTIDLKVRDIAEYIKFIFYSEILSKQKFDLGLIYDKLEFIETNCQLKDDEKFMLFVRLLYNTDFYDFYEKIINGESTEKNIRLAIKNTKEYEKLLLYLYNKINFYVKLPNFI